MWLSQFWSGPSGSSELWTKMLIALIAGFVGIFALSKAPTRARRPIVGAFTFFAGAFYVLLYLWPKPFDRKPTDLPLNFAETVGFWIEDAQPHVSNFANIIGALLLGLGIYSLLRVHIGRIAKRHADRWFSVLLLASMVVMVVFGYMDYYSREVLPGGDKYDVVANWKFEHYGWNFLFDAMLQQMDAAMFSIIAFFILSAAYRAFRVRSIESTILLAAALILMLSLMGAIEYASTEAIAQFTGGDAGHFLNNFRLKEVADWLKNNVQVPSLRAIDFGIGVGALAMGLRLWLSLERGGVGA